MSLAITGAAPQSVHGASTALPRSPAMREAMRDLTQSLKASDLAGARQANAASLKNAPDGAQFPRGSEFAKIGRAPVDGDIEATQAAFRSMVQGRLDVRSVPPLPPVPQRAAAKGAGLDLIA